MAVSRAKVRGFAVAAVFAVVSAWGPVGPLRAQQPNASSKTRPNDNANGVGNELGSMPDKVLKTIKENGVIKNVDLAARTVTIGEKKGGDLELSFSQPNGREQIKTSKKYAKSTGKKKLLLEEVKVGSKVQFEYYALLGQLMVLTVEE
ncbi:MAG: hypothetical protein GC160_20435 [Acidobacteria bacterium]|nr:hypothetical protein [Acidobacteriota bacterium]